MVLKLLSFDRERFYLRMKNGLFKGTAAEDFTTGSFIKRIMSSAVHFREKKTFVKVGFVKEYRHRPEIRYAI